jgi:hypothetical protein
MIGNFFFSFCRKGSCSAGGEGGRPRVFISLALCSSSNRLCLFFPLRRNSNKIIMMMAMAEPTATGAPMMTPLCLLNVLPETAATTGVLDAAMVTVETS